MLKRIYIIVKKVKKIEQEAKSLKIHAIMTVNRSGGKMKKELLTVGIALTMFSGCTFAATDYFLKNLSTCNPYKTVFKSNFNGQTYEKAVLGRMIDNTSHNIYCIYYKQKAPNEYQLCYKRMNAMISGKEPRQLVNCRMTNLSGIKEAEQSINEKDYFVEIGTEIITSPANNQEAQPLQQ